MANVYEMVTERIMAKLEEGIIPWEQPWAGGRNGAFNRVTKKPYSFLNQLLLGKPGEYATMKQWNKLGGKVKAGEKANLVVFWKPKKVVVKSDEDAEEIEDDEDVKVKTVPILRYYYVFHIDQIEGVKPLKAEEYPDNFVPDGDADHVISEYLEREGVGFTEEEGGNDSYYRPSTDSITVPTKKQFKSTNDYYATVFHEMTHSTGHEKRLNRISTGAKAAAFGSEDYGKEGLVAEIGAATIMNMLELETEKSFRNNTAYVQNWLGALKNDSRMIVSASSKAGKAVDYIFGCCEKKEKEVEKSVNNEDEKVVESKENKTKKKRRSHEEVIIDRLISQAKKNKGWKEPENYDIIDFDGEEYYGFSDGHMIMASKNTFGHEPKEVPNKSFSELFKPMEYTKFSGLEYIKTEISDVKAFIKEHGKDRTPYTFHTNKGWVGVNPSYFVDMVDFMEGTEEFYINPEAKYTDDGYYTGMLYFGDTVDQKIGVLLPVVPRPNKD